MQLSLASRRACAGMFETGRNRLTLQIFVLIVISALLTVAANLTMRYGLLKVGGFTLSGGAWEMALRLALQPVFVLGIICYGIASLVWFKVLSIAEISTSYPILVGMTFVLVTAGAVPLFHESFNMIKATGILVILAGIIIIARA